MNIRTKIAALLLGATLAVSCTKSLDTIEPGSSELDWSQTSTITLDRVTMAPSAKATADPLMKVGQTFRLYALDPKTKDIIATRSYTIATTDGIPVIDALQDPVITLPFGVVDVYLVGPVKATLYGGTEYVIADTAKVNPMRGVDLISSKTRVVVKARNTPITPTPLQHRMVKLELAVSMEKDGEPTPADLSSYKNAYMTGDKHGVGIDNVAGAGAWVFDDRGGSVTGIALSNCSYTYAVDNTGEQNLKLTDPGVTNGEGEVTGTAYSAYDYVFPNEATQPKLSVMFGYTFRTVPVDESGYPLVPENVDNHEMWGKTAMKLNWAAGTYVKLHTKLTPSINMTVHTQILAWDDGGTTPVAPPSNNDLIFWYSGEDQPEEIDGKMCWRDRSGNGNHATINGSMTYDAVNKCYYATADDASFAVPALGKLAEYTLELTAQSVVGAKNSAVDFEGATGVRIELPYESSIFFYPPTEHRYSYGNTDKYIYEQLNSYAFCRNSTTAAIVVNGSEKTVEADASTWVDFNNNKLWANTANVSPEKQRLYGAKMYKKYMNNTAGRNTLAANHAAKLSRLGVTAPLSGATFDYVKDGLIVNLANSFITTIDGGPAWIDQTGMGNHAALTGAYTGSGGLGGITLNGGYMTLIKQPLGNWSEITVEIVMSSTANRGYQSLLVANVDNKSGRRPMQIWWPWLLDTGAELSMSNVKIAISPSEYVYQMDPLAQISLSMSKANLVTFRHNGYAYTNKNTTSSMALPAFSEVWIGCNKAGDGRVIGSYLGTIYAVRIYNRALSDFERQHNYLVDKAKYKILP